MSLPLVMIAIGLVVITVGALAAWHTIHTIRRLRTQLVRAGWRLAHDPLTGLLNRAGLLAAHATMHTYTVPQPIVVILLDLDRFKTVNDTHGHHTGDQLLVTVGATVGQTAAVFDGVAARLSGDEYAAFIPRRGHDPARLAQTFAAMIAQPVEFTIDEHRITLTPTASVGAAIVEPGDPIQQVGLHRADIAMYHAKRDGGDGYRLYEPGMAMPTGQPRPGPHRNPRPGHRLRDRNHGGGEGGQQDRGVGA